jgi:hypothetical protein
MSVKRTVVPGETDDELVEGVEEHVQNDHPDLVGTMLREDILAMAEAAQASRGRRKGYSGCRSTCASTAGRKSSLPTASSRTRLRTAKFSGRYWARTSDPQLVELVLSQLS